MKRCHIFATHTLKPQTILSEIPGDKSISHRAIIIGSLAENESVFSRFLFAEDCVNTAKIFQALGVPITLDANTKTVTVKGVGLKGLKAPSLALDTGNSGTGIRLITGVLAGQTFNSIITGDTSIQKRPMKRITDPLKSMGAQITGQSITGKDDVFPPLTITGTPNLSALNYTLPVASAQVKSALLFASLYADGNSRLTEPKVSRNHTEVMLKTYGADLKQDQHTWISSGKSPLKNPISTPHIIPADFSSAAFFIVLGLLLPHTTWSLTHIGTNPTRTSLAKILKLMGASITIEENQTSNIEPFGTFTVQTSSLHNITVPVEEIPFLIDEIPILAIAALFGTGQLKITQAKELRVKESDRIASIVHIIEQMGGDITEQEDGFILHGKNGKIRPFTVNSNGDHRIAMSAIIAAIAGNVEATIENIDCINTSFPNFFQILASLGTTFKIEEIA